MDYDAVIEVIFYAHINKFREWEQDSKYLQGWWFNDDWEYTMLGASFACNANQIIKFLLDLTLFNYNKSIKNESSGSSNSNSNGKNVDIETVVHADLNLGARHMYCALIEDKHQTPLALALTKQPIYTTFPFGEKDPYYGTIKLLLKHKSMLIKYSNEYNKNSNKYPINCPTHFENLHSTITPKYTTPINFIYDYIHSKPLLFEIFFNKNTNISLNMKLMKPGDWAEYLLRFIEYRQYYDHDANSTSDDENDQKEKQRKRKFIENNIDSDTYNIDTDVFFVIRYLLTCKYIDLSKDISKCLQRVCSTVWWGVKDNICVQLFRLLLVHSDSDDIDDNHNCKRNKLKKYENGFDMMGLAILKHAWYAASNFKKDTINKSLFFLAIENDKLETAKFLFDYAKNINKYNKHFENNICKQSLTKKKRYYGHIESFINNNDTQRSKGATTYIMACDKEKNSQNGQQLIRYLIDTCNIDVTTKFFDKTLNKSVFGSDLIVNNLKQDYELKHGNIGKNKDGFERYYQIHGSFAEWLKNQEKTALNRKKQKEKRAKRQNKKDKK